MVKKCEITFTNGRNGVFLSGQTLAGSVELVLEKPKTVRSFKLEIHGFAKVSWSETHTTGTGKNRKSRRVTYTGHEDYLATKTYLVGADDGQQIVIPIGTHTYTFQCFLPLGTPTSFEGAHGHIRYTVKATLDRPWKFDQTSKVAFTVIRQVDLNHENPSLRLPAEMEVIKRFCCWPCQSAPLILNAQIPMSGYAPGQTIHIFGGLYNKSNVTVHAIHFKLMKTVTYFADSPSGKVRKQFLTVVEAETAATATDGYTKIRQALIIPAVAPSNLTQSKVIHQTYEVIVEASVSGCHRNPVVSIPITIGTVPLRQHPESPLATAPGLENHPFIFPVPAAPPLDQDWQENTQFLELPPPTYEECVMAGSIAVESTNENPISSNSFTPKYPVYNYGWDMN